MPAAATGRNGAGVAPPPINAGEQLQSIIAPLEQTLEQGEAHVEFLRAQANAQDTENRKVRKVLSTLLPEKYGAKSHHATKRGKPGVGHAGVKRENGTATGFGITMEMAKEGADWMLAGDKDWFVQREVYEAMGWDQGKASAAFKWFRDIGFVRKAGTHQRAEKWVIMDKDAVNMALAEAERRRDEMEVA